MAAVAAVSTEVDIEVWPENWPAFDLFCRVRTQWFVGFGGPTGLRYEAIYPLLDRMGLSPADWEQAFADIQLMESAALQQISDDIEASKR
jgi:hypothetical protein